MKNLSIAAIVEKNKLMSDQPWLVALKVYVKDRVSGLIVDHIRVVANNEKVTIDGEEYEPFPFSINWSETASGLPTVKIVIQDQTQIVQGYMQNYAGGVGLQAELIVVTGDDKNALSTEAELVEYFFITNSSVANYVVSWELGVENPVKGSFPKRKQYQNQCSFRYRSGDCGYNGALPSCSLTLDGVNGCRAHNNAPNFGGYPGIIVRG